MRIRLALALLFIGLVAGVQAEPTPRWGWVGVRIRDLSEQEMNDISAKFGLREGFGAMIVEVLKETPAEASGLEAGDVVVAVRGQPVVDTRTLQRYIAAAPVGEVVPMTVLRGPAGRRPVSVRVGVMPDAVAAERVAAEFGFFVREPNAQGEPGDARPASAPTVTAVVPRSRAAAAGLRPGDVLMEVNGRPVENVSGLREVLLAVSPDAPLALVVRRDRERVTVSIDRARSL